MYRRSQTRARSYVSVVPAQEEFCARRTGVHVRSTTGLFEMIHGDVEIRADVCRITKGAHIEHLYGM